VVSRADDTGLHSVLLSPVFTLPDFRVATRLSARAVALGRSGKVRERMLKALDAVAGLRHFVPPGDLLLVKPNVAFGRSHHLGATTNPELIETLLQRLLVDARAAEVRAKELFAALRAEKRMLERQRLAAATSVCPQSIDVFSRPEAAHAALA
jgi:hypothetical protein